MTLVGTSIHSRYLITSLLGKQRGRRTFLATDLETQSQVVLKLVLLDPDFTWQDLKLFEREAQTLQSLKHPALPNYLDSFETKTPIGNGYVLVQTYIEAKSLRDWVSGGYTFSETELRAIATSLLNILIYLHQQNPPVIHRDIKPSNILFLGDRAIENSVYLVDFGSVQTAANTTGTMTVVGTYGYMPPEQFGGRAQPASDLYSLGATLVYLATGQHPAELTQQTLQADSALLKHLSPSFRHWIQQLTQADLTQRMPSAQSALQHLTNPNSQGSDALMAVSQEPSDTSLVLRSVHRDFRAFCNEQTLEFQFSPKRLLLNPIPVPNSIISFRNAIAMASISFTAMALTLAALYGVVIGLAALVLNGVSLTVFVALFFAVMAFGLYAAQRKKRKQLKQNKRYQTASLNVTKQGSRLSLNVFIDTYTGRLKEHFEFCSNLPVDSISANKNSTVILFKCIENRTERTIYLTGDRDDLRWVFNRLNQWNQPVDGQ